MKGFLFLVLAVGFSSFFNSTVNAQDIGKGKTLYAQCILCHGEKGEGNPSQKAPKLSGQYDWYVLKQLKDIKAGSVRSNPVMVPFLNKLNEQDMKDLAAYIATL